MRRILVLLHRWAGLLTALFLFVAGATGAIIAWERELDALLNPQLFVAQSGASHPRAALALADELELRDPRVRVQYLPLHLQPGRTLFTFVEPRENPTTGAAYDLPFDQAAIDPATGALQATRKWGRVSLARENLIPFLYELHSTLHLSAGFGPQTGVLVMGGVALVWLFDALVALVISFPNRRVWRRSFSFRWDAGGARLLFDLHRSTGVWAWPVLVVFAFSAVCMNLEQEVVRPALSSVAAVTPEPDSRTPPTRASQEETRLSRAEAIAIARAEAQRRDLDAPAGGILYDFERASYSVGFFAPDNEYGNDGLGSPWLHVDAVSGKITHASIPTAGTAADRVLALQFPIHSGRIAGLSGRTFVTLLGVLIALLSVTGVVMFTRRRLARALHDRRRHTRADGSALTS